MGKGHLIRPLVLHVQNYHSMMFSRFPWALSMDQLIRPAALAYFHPTSAPHTTGKVFFNNRIGAIFNIETNIVRPKGITINIVSGE